MQKNRSKEDIAKYKKLEAMLPRTPGEYIPSEYDKVFIEGMKRFNEIGKLIYARQLAAKNKRKEALDATNYSNMQ